ncbi:uncharacterized protein LOC114531372 [Dendronephthya gigantea]|uniref:uncharacterized protein LOC114531372 n=1 Tax=Dendronephthya gigantea TaxID=151771 RepID=UPI001068E8D5|nr:uncharacterized protein LOC114531372 [Dendronephthya gigantea]
MSSNESKRNESLSENSSKSKSAFDDSDTSSSGSMGYVESYSLAYDDEPLADPEENTDLVTEDPDGLLPATLEKRLDGRIPLEQWCSCKCCQIELLDGAMEYRCCKEMTPALRIMTFDGSIEKITCITQHEDFGPMTYQTVLENVGPLLRDRNGRSYRRRGSQSLNQYLRAVAYRWLIKWMCGLLGWENTRPLPACVYHLIRKKYPTPDTKGYTPAEQRM